ncbi:LLM class flavin-dependent oxidoreductase [Subtercola vilae]|uniref:LLM class flavin-dependent oxidoreductase n=1 Tax=Subtercola vilae TaxID=2056433 RepID=A0A4V4RER8_9MICO|nr:LLM class flavin-dependent oxidoreductase [Subtercola vilae]TIH34824.1 LLM class flavin-dependent oxidoreductase [Subtercola vilae]
MTSPALHRVHLGAFYPNDHYYTLWSKAPLGSQVEFVAFRHFAQSAERGLFDFVFLAEANWLQEHRGRVVEHAIMDKPDSLTVLAALAAETTRVGLVATIGTTFSDPYTVARQLETLQALSGHRAGWNVVTSHTTFGVGASTNFRPGRMVAHADRYRAAAAFLEGTWGFWGDHEKPVIVQAGGSDEGRALAAAHADVIFTGRRSLPESREFLTDLAARAATHGRPAPKVLPSTAFVLGDSQADADERAREWAQLEMTPAVARFILEEVWGGDLTDFDVDGPLPGFDPDWKVADAYTRGGVDGERDARTLIARWRDLSEREHLSVRQLFGTVLARRDFVGTPLAVAEQINHWVQSRASDGFVVNPSVVPGVPGQPGGLDEFVDRVVPELQNMGVYPAEYAGESLREHITGGDARHDEPERHDDGDT